MEKLPAKLIADIDTANGGTPLADLVKLGVALAQARDTGHDTFQPALKLKNLIAAHMDEDPLKTLVGLKQCKIAGTASGGGVFSIMRGLDGGVLEAWLDKPENLEGFAAGMEDAAAVLVSPGVINTLGMLVAGWETAIGAAPESAPEYSVRADSHRRISEAYMTLISGVEMWGGPAALHTGLVDVMNAAKNEQLAGDPAALLIANAEMTKGLKMTLDDAGAMTALGANRDLVSAWVDSSELMEAVWDSPVATETLLKSEIFRDELLKPLSLTAIRSTRVGYGLLLKNHAAWLIFLANPAARQALWTNEPACSTMWRSETARQEIWANTTVRQEIWANSAACKSMWNNSTARQEMWANPTARQEMWANPTARQALWATNSGCKWVWRTPEARQHIWADSAARQEVWASRKACQSLWSSTPARQELWSNPVAFKEMLGSATARRELWGNPNACKELWRSTAAFSELWANADARRELWGNPNACKELWRSTAAFSELWANADARRELWGNPNACKELWQSTAALNPLAKNADAIDDLTRNHNTALQDARDSIAATVRNSKGKFVKVETVFYWNPEALNNKAKQYPNSIILATLGNQYGIFTTMVHKNGVVAASRNDGTEHSEVTVVSGVSFTGATFTSETKCYTTFEIWQAV